MAGYGGKKTTAKSLVMLRDGSWSPDKSGSYKARTA